MGKKIDLTGQRFGRLVVIEEAGRNKRKLVLWKCLCDCSKEVVVTTCSLRSGNTRSCGCIVSERAGEAKRKDLSGMRFGRLKAIEPCGRKRGYVLWLCHCDCGNSVQVISASLLSGNTQSCGCSKAEAAIASGLKKRIYQSIKERVSSPIKEKSRLFKKIPKCDNPAVGVDGFVYVSCKLCGMKFKPSYQNIKNRINSYNGKAYGENNFYCSDLCREVCPVFNIKSNQVDPRIREPKATTDKIRDCQRKTLKQLQCDENHGQSYCERCGDLIDVELHHTLPVAEYGEDAINPAGHMLLCAGCHVALHRECA